MDKPTDQPKTAKGYKPETFEVRGRYSAIAVMNNGTYEAADAEFDRWLASVKAEAWAECQSAMDERQLLVDVSGRYRDPVLNPYLENAK